MDLSSQTVRKLGYGRTTPKTAGLLPSLIKPMTTSNSNYLALLQTRSNGFVGDFCKPVASSDEDQDINCNQQHLHRGTGCHAARISRASKL